MAQKVDPAGEPCRRVRIQHYRPLRTWPRTQATFAVPRGSFRLAMSFFTDPDFGGAAEVLLASAERPVAGEAWQVVFRERFEEDRIMEMRTTAVHLQRGGFQVELFEEAVAVWDAMSDDETQLGSK
eukprot:s436_g53.t1